MSIRLFDDYLRLLAGLSPSTCAASGACGSYLVVEGDGSLYPCDFFVLDEWYMGNINEIGVGQAINSPRSQAFLERGYTRPQACAQCPYFVLCRGAVPGTGPCSPPVEKITTAQPSANFLHMLCHACVRRRQPSHDKKKALSGPSGPLRAFYKVRMEVPS